MSRLTRRKVHLTQQKLSLEHFDDQLARLRNKHKRAIIPAKAAKLHRDDGCCKD